MGIEQDDLGVRVRRVAASPHPRLGVRSTDLSGDQGVREAYFTAVADEARRLLPIPVLTRQMEGRRLLAVSREALRRITVLSLAWMRTRDAVFVSRAEAEMLAVCAFSDWNPSHFLDTAEMSLGVALGYDWLYEALPESSRVTLAQGLWRLGLQLAVPVGDTSPGWVQARNNWGQVCHAGMTAAALALADRHPEAAETVIRQAVIHLPLSMESYAPDGVYPEGPMYWDYGTSFNVIFLILVESALGTTFGLDHLPGFLESAAFMRHVTAPSGYLFNYADCHDARRCMISLLWFADRDVERYGGHASGYFDPEWRRVTEAPQSLMRNRVAPFLMVAGFHADPAKEGVPEPPLDYHGRGPTELVILRSAWDDPTAWHVGVKSGTPSVSHGHMDAGGFVLEADGVRWALEAGMASYHELESQGYDLWDGSQDGSRWEIFRYGNRSHNIPVINDARQRISARADVVRAVLDVPDPHVEVDLSKLYGASVTRTFDFPGRSRLVVGDVCGGLAPGDVVRWQMLTSAEAVERDGVLVLNRDGKTLVMTVDTPVCWEIVEAAALYQAWDTPLADHRMVRFTRVAGKDGRVSHRVTFTPGVLNREGR